MMKNAIIILVLASILVSCNTYTDEPTLSELNIDAVYTLPKVQIDSFVVLELFTSESCYDCPPAQEGFNQFIEEYHSNLEVICLSEHVDYWNSLVWGEGDCRGVWVDKYADGFYSARQFAYAKAIDEVPATPQVFANGKGMVTDPTFDDYVHLAKENKKKPAYNIALFLGEERFENEHTLLVHYGATLDTSFIYSKQIKPVLILFLIQDRVESFPDVAENCGEHLVSDYVARSMAAAVIKKNSSGILKLNIPEDLDIGKCRVMGIVQEIYNLDVLAATQGFAIKVVE